MDKDKLRVASTVFFLIIIIYTGLLLITFANTNLHEKLFAKYNIAEELPEYDVSELNKETISYLFGFTPLELTAFTEPEREHLSDVRLVVEGILSLFFIALGGFGICLFLIVKEHPIIRFEMATVLIYTGWISLGIMIVLGTAILFFFPQFFRFMHQILFPHGNWQFDPNIFRIVVLYPREFWISVSKSYVFDVILWSIFSLLGGYFIRYRESRKF